ncbi:MAG: class I SAM-dependent methyltransferase [Clostridia bacterium]|nr:class I SAM-dependent methyltransferase [Clostridia bacterium]
MNHYDNPQFFAAYAQISRSRQGLDGAGEWHRLQSLFPDPTGKNVLDLGCGYGWHCKYAADHGAKKVLGIDGSEKMIAEAIKRNAHEKIDYRLCCLQDYDYPEASFDLVVSNLVLHYVEDLDIIYRRIYKTLCPGGVFLMNIEHPTFTAGVNQQFSGDGTWPVDNYYYPGERQTDFLGHIITKYHHTLTQILGGLLNAGFRIKAVEEAMPPEEWRAVMPEEMRRPMMLLVKAVRENG